MRLFGLDGAADEDPSSPTGLVSPGLIGLPSATAADILLGPASANLQGGWGVRAASALDWADEVVNLAQ